MFKFHPQEFVEIKVLQTIGRVNRCIYDGSLQAMYSVRFIINGECREVEFFEDELALRTEEPR